MARINKLEISRVKFDSHRMTDLNHFTKNMMIKPEIFADPARLIFASRTNAIDLSEGNFLERMFGLDKTRYIDDLTWQWNTKVAGYVPMTILEGPAGMDSTSTPGKYRSDINILVDRDLAQIGESWGPGSSDKSQICVVVDKKPAARGFLYTLRTYVGNAEMYIKPQYLQPGWQWTRFYTMRGEAAESGGYFESSSQIKSSNNLVKLRKEFRITDYAAQAVLKIAITDDKGRTFNTWMDFAEARSWQQMNKEVTMHALYSRLGDQPLRDPDSGYPINPGAGLYQQIEFGGNVEGYTELSAELLEAFFDRIVYSRISPGDLGEVIGFTGHYGMKALDKALKTWLGEQSVILTTADIMSKDPQGAHKNSLMAGYQFTSYRLPNGGSFRLIYNPLNDDKELHRDLDPRTGVPLESQRITILDVTGGNNQSISGKNNIFLVKKNKVYGASIIEGRYGPGGIISKNPKHAGDYYEVHISDSVGIQVTDPTVTGELIKRVN